MLFNSFTFLLIFLPVSLIVYFSLSKWRLAAIVWLVACSLFFYGFWNIQYLPLLLISVCFNYLIGLTLQRNYAKSFYQDLVAYMGVSANLLALIYYKYLYYAITTLNAHHFPWHIHEHSIALPLGLSFFTFTQIGYLLDCRSGIAKGKNIFEYALFVTFFPHLISGPILHHREMLPQFEDPQNFKYKTENLAVGTTMFTFGLAKKLIIADPISPYVNNLLHHSGECSTLQSWLLAIAYALQLYFDFSGYSDMAIGLARMFGFKFPANFNSPFRARSIIDFWQRWHMTLTRYLTLYLFNPMALSITRYRATHNLAVGKASTATAGGFMQMLVFPTLVTMTLAGIWHGAGLQFLFYGLMHAFYLITNHIWRVFGPKPQVIAEMPKPLNVLYHFASWVVTIICVIVAFIMFRAENYHQAISIYKSMFEGISGPGIAPSIDKNELTFIYITMAVATVIVLTLSNTQQLLWRFTPVIGKTHPNAWQKLSWGPTVGWAASISALLVLAILHVDGVTEFLYFKF
jgi:D-alanyl-lipoteichoic acid acyltransferase DltB (MBOAT superfamily)